MIGIYSDKGGIYFWFKRTKQGKTINLKYFPGLSDKGFNKLSRRFRDDELNRQMIKIENAISDITEKQDPFTLNTESFTRLINDKLTGKNTQKTPFFGYCDGYYQETLCKHKKASMRQIQATINKLKDFSPDLTFEQVDRKFYRDFLQYLRSLNLSLNYTGDAIKNLKRILNHATDSGINENLTFREFKKPMENVFNIYLSEQEIESIYNLKIDELACMQIQKENTVLSKMTINRQIESLDRARKLFVIGCCTGLRAENYLNIDPDIQVKDGFLHCIMNKGGQKIKIPLHKFVREIVESGGFPKPVSQQRLNDSIKILGEMAGIKEQVIFTKTEGNRIIEVIKPKYKLIKSHTARRSFCSNLYAKGVPIAYIMAVSGHKSESTFRKYIRQVKHDELTEKLKDYDVWG